MNSPVFKLGDPRTHFMIAFGLACFQNGVFLPLFNILSPSNDSNLNCPLPFYQPTDFPALDLPATHPTTQNGQLQAGVYALENILTFSAAGLDR